MIEVNGGLGGAAGGGPVAPTDITGATEAGLDVLTGTPEEGRAALEAASAVDLATVQETANAAIPAPATPASGSLLVYLAAVWTWLATTAFGRGLLALADAAAARVVLAVYSSAQVDTALALKQSLASKDAALGYAGLDASGKINPAQIPSIAITDTFPVASEAAMLALDADVGDIAPRSDLNQTFILRVAGASVLAHWELLLSPTDAVSSVFGRAGVVTAQSGDYTKAQVGLGNVDNTSDVNKPVSTAQQTAFNLKANIASPTFTGNVGGITKAMVGLGNADNTSDVDKPVSTAQAAAIAAASGAATSTAVVTTAPAGPAGRVLISVVAMKGPNVPIPGARIEIGVNYAGWNDPLSWSTNVGTQVSRTPNAYATSTWQIVIDATSAGLATAYFSGDVNTNLRIYARVISSPSSPPVTTSVVLS